MGNQSSRGRAPVGDLRLPCACFGLRKAARSVTRLYDETLRPSGLRVTQLTLLVAVSRLGSILPKDLAEHTVMSRSTLSRNLRVLERQGFVRLQPGPQDGRERPVTLTRKGRGALLRALPLWNEAQARMRDTLGEDVLARLLEDLATAVDKTRVR